MGYIDKYQTFLESVPEIIRYCYESGKRLAIGYTSNLDVVVDWDERTFNQMLKDNMPESLFFNESEPITTVRDLARVVSFFAANGLGGEAEVADIQVVNEVMRRFDFCYGLGGTCAQGAAALGAIGMPAIIHLTDRSEKVINFLGYKGIELVEREGLIPVADGGRREQSLIHLIMQYAKDGKFSIGDESFQAPLSNRIIIDYDQIHKVLPVDPAFTEYIEAHAGDICSYDISGFNAIQDMEVLKERVDQMKAHYERVKAKNPNVYIYLESAHYISSKARGYVYESFAENLDILGMNEEELVDFIKKSGFTLNKDDIESVVASLDYILEEFAVRGIVLHTKDYSMYYGCKLKDADIELGLTMGNLMSGTRARIGAYGSLDDLRETLGLQLSVAGLAFHAKLQQMSLKHHAVLVPSRYLEHPKYTIGLGDTFVAGVQLGFIR